MQKEVVKCHKGWEKLYEPIVKKILDLDSIRPRVEDKIGIRAIINENGMLKFVLNNKDNLPSALNVSLIGAEIDSLKVCEYCGATEHIGNTYSHIMTTCCQECFDKNIKSLYPTEQWVENKNLKNK